MGTLLGVHPIVISEVICRGPLINDLKYESIGLASSHRPAHGPKHGRVLCIVTRVVFDTTSWRGMEGMWSYAVMLKILQEGRSNSTKVPNPYLISGWPSKNRGKTPKNGW